MEPVILVRYGEIGLKGQNRPAFERQLLANLRRALEPLPAERVRRVYGRLVVEPDDTVSADEAVARLQRVFGVVSVSPGLRVPVERDAMLDAAAAVAQRALDRRQGPNAARQSGSPTFKVDGRRANKRFALDSMAINREVGAHLLRAFPSLRVDVHRPDFVVTVEVRDEGIYVFSEVLPGPGGLPLGASGRAMLLISGGIDSPVAGWLAMKRGIELLAVHFHSFPFTSERSRDKVVDLCRLLARYGGPARLFVVHFTDVQTAIHRHCPERLLITIMRRMMVRIAERLARQHGALALVTGESVGQVASQTLESLYTIGEVAGLPILRPLITYDKAEIVALAQQIGTYETSILPYEDCCTLFVPRHPETRPRPEKARAAEAALDIEALVAGALSRTEEVVITGSGAPAAAGDEARAAWPSPEAAGKGWPPALTAVPTSSGEGVGEGEE